MHQEESIRQGLWFVWVLAVAAVIVAIGSGLGHIRKRSKSVSAAAAKATPAPQKAEKPKHITINLNETRWVLSQMGANCIDEKTQWRCQDVTIKLGLKPDGSVVWK